MVSYAATMALLADCGWLVSGFSSKKAIRSFEKNIGTCILLLIRVLPVMVLLAVIGLGTISFDNALMAVVAGLFLGIGYFTYYYSLHQELLSKTIATNEIQPVVLVLLGTLILGEALSNIAVLGILLIFAGVSLVVINQGFSFNRKLIPGIVGSGSWAIYWLIMTYAIQGSGNFALCVFISQLICMGMMLVYLAIDKKAKQGVVVAFQESLRGNRTALVSLGLVTLLAFSNGFADTVFAYVIQSGRVSIAGSINALVPVFVVVFAYLVYKERLSRLQYVGVVAAIVGAALVTLF